MGRAAGVCISLLDAFPSHVPLFLLSLVTFTYRMDLSQAHDVLTSSHDVKSNSSIINGFPCMTAGSSMALLKGGHKPPFRLMAAIRPDSGRQPVISIRPGVSGDIVVATQRIRCNVKAKIPHVRDKVERLERIGRETAKKLLDISAAATGVGISNLNVPENRVETGENPSTHVYTHVYNAVAHSVAVCPQSGSGISSDRALSKMAHPTEGLLGSSWALKMHSACGLVDFPAVKGTLELPSAEWAIYYIQCSTTMCAVDIRLCAFNSEAVSGSQEKTMAIGQGHLQG